MTQRIHASLVAATLAIFASVAAADFADPLDTPAAKSALAPNSVVNGLARAGERIIAVGVRGHILYSDDAGDSWTQADVPVRSDLTAVSFPDAQHGWAVGHDGVVLATEDGGVTWRKQLDGRALGALLVDYYARNTPAGLSDDALALLRADAQRTQEEGPDKPFLDVWFADARRGFVVGVFNLIFATADGGRTWTPWLDRTDNPRAYHFYAVRPVGNDVYLAGEQGLLLKLDREAQRFRALDLPYRGTLFGVAGDASAVTAFGLRGNAWRSADGGASWTQVATGVEVSLTAATHDAQGGLVLVSQTGQVLGADGDAMTTARRVPASAVLALPDGTLLIGGPTGLHTITTESRRSPGLPGELPAPGEARRATPAPARHAPAAVGLKPDPQAEESRPRGAPANEATEENTP